MFRSKNTDALFFKFKKPTKLKIHSFFVFFSFVAVWLDGKNKAVDIRKVKPFAFSASSKKPFTGLLEIPINKKYSSLIRFLISRR